MRQMATVQKIDSVYLHTNAEKLEMAAIGGWQCIVEKGKHTEGELVVFCEVDSWVPHEIFPMLSKGKEPREYNGVKGERLRSIKLRGALSQGLILPLSVLPRDSMDFGLLGRGTPCAADIVGKDVSEILNIQKWERPISPALAGQAKGYFPSFLRKTDQERIQNQFKTMDRHHFNDEYEVTLKLDGSSMTVYYNNGEFGVCSRNLELKINEENSGNAFIKKAIELGLEEKMRAFGHNIAIQGELWGIGINGNWEGISHHEFSVFDIFNIDTQEYVTAQDRFAICVAMGLQHTPVIEHTNLERFKSVQDFLTYAERPSIYNKIAEGVVFKSLSNPEYSFKAVSNSYLLNGGE